MVDAKLNNLSVNDFAKDKNTKYYIKNKILILRFGNKYFLRNQSTKDAKTIYLTNRFPLLYHTCAISNYPHSYFQELHLYHPEKDLTEN